MAELLKRPRVFLDVQIGTQPAGRIVIELFTDKTPKTCENFRSLCSSSCTPLGASKSLSYKLSPFHRIIDEFMVQGGDITTGDGTGGQSIYNKVFADENIGWREIDSDGLACMANRGKDTNTSQFFITLAPCQHLNAKHTIFGHVVSGMDVVKRMATVDVDKSDRPVEPVIVTHCGELERRKKVTTTVNSRISARDETYAVSSDRGRKRTKSSRFESPSASQSRSDASSDRHSHKKHHKNRISPKLPAPNSRRRSDIPIDETRRGLAESRSQSPYSSKSKPSLTGRRPRKRSISPSRSRSPPASTSPHLRRRHGRSRDRSPAASQQRPQGYKDSLWSNEHLIQSKEQERQGGRDRYEGVVEEGYITRGQGRRSEHYRHGERHGGPQGGYGRLGSGDGGDDTGGEIKFKGRGRMKYTEKKW